MSFIAIGTIGGLTLGAGGLALGTVGAFMGDEGGSKGTGTDPYAEMGLRQLLNEYNAAKANFQEVLKSKPWKVDAGEMERAQKLIPQLDEAIASQDMNKAHEIITQMPYFEQMYRDQIIFKYPQLSQMLQKTALTWGHGLRTPSEEKLWEDVTGSSRRGLGREKDLALEEADRLAAMAGRPGTAGGEHAAIIDKYLRAYGEQEKSIRSENTLALLDKIEKGMGLATAERAYGSAAVEQAYNRKVQAQTLVNQLVTALASSSVGARTPSSGGSGGPSATSRGLTKLGADLSAFGGNITGMSMNAAQNRDFNKALDKLIPVAPIESSQASLYNAGAGGTQKFNLAFDNFFK